MGRRSRRQLPAAFVAERVRVGSSPAAAAPSSAASSVGDESEAGRAQRRAALLSERVGDDVAVPEHLGGAPRGAQEHRAGIGRAVGADAPHLGREAVFQLACDGPAEDGDAAQAVVGGDGDDADAGGYRPVMAMMLGDEGVRLSERGRNDREARSSVMRA